MSISSSIQAGFSTIELLIAFSVGIIFLTSAMLVAFSAVGTGQKVSLDNGQEVTLDVLLDSEALTISTYRSQYIVEHFAKNWRGLLQTVHTFFFTYNTLVTDISPCMKQVQSKTTWTRAQERIRTIEFGTGIANAHIAKALGKGECDANALPEDAWRNPQNANWKTPVSGMNGTQSGLDLAVIDGNTYAFVTTMSTTQTDDLWVVDVSDTTKPEVIASLETGYVGNITGLIDIDVVTTPQGAFAYIIQNSVTNQLQVINVTDPHTLKSTDIENVISLEAYGVSPSGSNPVPKVLTYYDGRLYIGLFTTIGPEFLVFDVRNDPAHPVFLGALPNSFDHSINDILVRDGYAYLAIAPGSSARTTNELMILDVSKNIPKNTERGYNASSTTTDTEAGTALYMLGNTLYMGRERVSNALESDVYVFDVSSSTMPLKMKSQRLGISTGGGIGTPRVTDIEVHGRLAFIATTDSVKSLQVYDVLRDPNNLVPLLQSCGNSLPLPRLTEIVYKDGFVHGIHGTTTTLSILSDNKLSCHL